MTARGLGASARRRAALVEWLRGERHDDAALVREPLPLRAGDDHRPHAGECWSVQELIYALWDDDAVVPADVRDMLGFGSENVRVSTLVRWMHAHRLDRRSATHAQVVERLRDDARRDAEDGIVASRRAG